MVLILMALLVFASILIVGYPLVSPEKYRFETMTSGDDRVESLQSQRNAVFEAIRDLEFDHDTGKLSEEDYRKMRARYDVQAAEVLQKMDALAVAARGRASRRARPVTPASDNGFCGKCGTAIKAGDRFCPKCGNRLG